MMSVNSLEIQPSLSADHLHITPINKLICLIGVYLKMNESYKTFLLFIEIKCMYVILTEFRRIPFVFRLLPLYHYRKLPLLHLSGLVKYSLIFRFLN